MSQLNTITNVNYIDSFLLKKKKNYILLYNFDNKYQIIFIINYFSCDTLNLSFSWKNCKKTLKLYKYVITGWKRIIFKGKGYRVRIFRNAKKITLNFGYSHWTKIKFIYCWDFFKLYRQNYLVFNNSMSDIKNFSLIFSTIKPMNRYTLRGLRFKKQTIKRRFGKISQYISSLH